jgi:hypothetical protein
MDIAADVSMHTEIQPVLNKAHLLMEAPSGDFSVYQPLSMHGQTSSLLWELDEPMMGL